MWYGEQLEEVMEMGPGDLIYIPAGVPHRHEPERD